jgi:hypothetical protein
MSIGVAAVSLSCEQPVKHGSNDHEKLRIFTGNDSSTAIGVGLQLVQLGV